MDAAGLGPGEVIDPAAAKVKPPIPEQSDSSCAVLDVHCHTAAVPCPFVVNRRPSGLAAHDCRIDRYPGGLARGNGFRVLAEQHGFGMVLAAFA